MDFLCRKTYKSRISAVYSKMWSRISAVYSKMWKERLSLQTSSLEKRLSLQISLLWAVYQPYFAVYGWYTALVGFSTTHMEATKVFLKSDFFDFTRFFRFFVFRSILSSALCWQCWQGKQINDNLAKTMQVGTITLSAGEWGVTDNFVFVSLHLVQGNMNFFWKCFLSFSLPWWPRKHSTAQGLIQEPYISRILLQDLWKSSLWQTWRSCATYEDVHTVTRLSWQKTLSG